MSAVKKKGRNLHSTELRTPYTWRKNCSIDFLLVTRVLEFDVTHNYHVLLSKNLSDLIK